ncbi:PTS mannitol transporter subunit IICB [Agreia pratensis]|uniref:PTS mannitol transporter subunit IICB n=1 Tax=Agreia pratensis TaxID=150121 RepID=UPI00188CB8BA|nr:PTS mannitol transporter subunit IICB [Agreia pratensis]MBF4635427.1 PTS mannitol transporter subunit IICB [Agreia pratensis]
MTTTSAPAKPGGARVRVQQLGTFLSGMVMPNLPAFIAWGLITSLFISAGWLPNGILGGFGDAAAIGWPGAATTIAVGEDGKNFQQYAGLVGPMITYLLPLLIANTGGRMVYGQRGGVIATIATMGVIVGSTIPMFLGAMIVGPLAAWIMKQIDKIWDGKIRPGFEMLVNNFSGGIVGGLLAIGAFFGVAPLIQGLTNILSAGIDALLNAGLLPLTSIIIEPAKVLFLNNAINHGVITPVATPEALANGKSILFLLEANPGPGVGILLAFAVFGVGAARASAPGAIIIQFFGGIHEIYFPYVLMKPQLIVAAIGGGMTGVATNVLFNSGLVGPAAPGSIIAVLAVTAKDSYIGVILSVILAATVSFLISAVLLRASRKKDLAAEAAGDDALAAAVAQNAANKGGESRVGALLGGDEVVDHGQSTVLTETRLQNIVFACDAGMGSSAMGASVLRNKLKKAGISDVNVTNVAIANLDDDVDLVITHKDLTDRARQKTPNAQHVSVDNFMNSPKYDEVVNQVAAQHPQDQA